MQQLIDVNKIVPSPFQVRKHRDEEKLKELAASIMKDGLIAPVVVRRNGKNGSYQNLAGGRRLEAIRKYTDIKVVPAEIVDVDGLQARRISAAENLQREDLSAGETVEAIVEIVDAELIGNKEYGSMGRNPAHRMKTLLGKLHSISISKKRGSEITKKSDLLFNKFIKQTKKIFKIYLTNWNGSRFTLMTFRWS
jgi:ParB-like chromosome segregation protein Spo0J